MSAAEGRKLGASLKENAEPTSISVPVLKNYIDENGREKEFVNFKTIDVYNAEQFDGLGEYSAPEKTSYTPKEALEAVLDRFRSGERARNRQGIPPIIGERLEAGRQSPNYNKTSGKERIRLPLRSQFSSDEAYLQSLFHELAHSTLDRNRTGRGLEGTPEGRAKEEVIAEMASAILINEFGLDYDTENSAEYIKSQALGEGLTDADIADASVKAQAAVDYLLGNDVLPKWEPNQTKNYATETSVRNTELSPLYSSVNPEASPEAIDRLNLPEDESVSLNQETQVSSSQKAVQKVLDGLLDKIKDGLQDMPWRRPYKDGFEYVGGSGLPRNPKTKHVYSGVNRFVLALVGKSAGYKDARWMTYKQAQDMGGQVRKGEKGVSILIPRITKYDKDKNGNPILDDNGNPTTRQAVFFTSAAVFNVEQIDGLNLDDDKATTTDMSPLEAQNFVLERYKKNLEAKGLTSPEISYTYVGEYGNHFGGDSSPNWSPTRDEITLPRESQFNSPEEWFETLMHELVHSTGHPDRLDRTDITKNYGTDRAARGLEELIAEMGAASLGEMFGVQYDFENTSAYLQGWQKAISETDFSSFQTASNMAQQAIDYILGMDLGDWSPLEGYNVKKSSTSDKES